MRRGACFGGFLLLGVVATGAFAGSGADLAATIEELRKAEKLLVARQKESFGAFVTDCLEKGIGPPALDALKVLEVLDPCNPDWGARRARARSLGRPQRGYLAWGRVMFKRRSRKAAGAWRDLMEKARELELRSTTRHFAEVVTTLDPGDKEARGILGHVKVKREWLPEYDARQAKMGLRFDPYWGYVTGEEKEKLAKGLRPRGEEWLPAEEEENTPRSWKERVIFDDRFVRVISNDEYDRALSFHLELRRLFRRLDMEFGDFFHPPDDAWPLRIFLCRTRENMKGVMAELGTSVDSLPVCHLQNTGDTIVARLDGAPWGSPTTFTVRDRVLRNLMKWFLEKATKGKETSESPNAWVRMGLEALAESRALFETRNVRPFGCFKAYLELKEKGRLPTLKKLFEVTTRGGYRDLDEFHGAALTHFLLHGEGGRYRIRFLGLAREFLLGRPTRGDLPEAMKMTAEEIERMLDIHMKDLLGE